MNDIEEAIRWFDGRDKRYALGDKRAEMERIALDALKEKQERDSRMQWLDDMNNPLEPIKIEAALRSEILKHEFRKANKPKSISELDYTIMAALSEALKARI